MISIKIKSRKIDNKRLLFILFYQKKTASALSEAVCNVFSLNAKRHYIPDLSMVIFTAEECSPLS